MSKYGERNDNFEDLSSYSSPDEYRKRKKNRKGRIVLKSIMGVFSVLLVVVGFGMMRISADLIADINIVPFTKDNEKLGIGADATNDDSIKNIAFFGLDSRNGSFKGNSDAIMIVTVDNKHKKIKMTSILRDSRIDDIEGIGASKINAAYDVGGAELAIKTINQNFKLNITEYVTVNFGNMAEIVDAFNGTVITMDDEEAYYTNENINALMYEQIHDGYERTIWESDFLPIEEDGYVKGGTFTLNGNQAVAYARNRADSDADRANRQKNVLMGLFTRLNEMSSINEYYSMAQQIFPKCETSLDFSDLSPFIPMLSGGYQIETLNIPGEDEAAFGGDLGDGLGWVYSYDIELAAQHIDRFIYEKDSQYYTEGNTSTSAAQ